MDAFGSSLIYTNRLYSIRYRRSNIQSKRQNENNAFKPLQLMRYASRRTATHMPLMFNKNIIAKLRETFRENTEVSSGSHFRRFDDIQFPFAYEHFLLEEQETVTFPHIFRKCDVDKSGSIDGIKEINCLEQASLNPYSSKLIHILIQSVQKCLYEKNQEKGGEKGGGTRWQTYVGSNRRMSIR